MLYRIVHFLDHSHSKPVFHEPHVFYLYPRGDGTQRLHDFRLRIDPKPVTVSYQQDAFGNTAIGAWFEGLVPALHVRAESLVETKLKNPFAYLAAPAAHKLPMQYRPGESRALAPFRRAGAADKAVAAYAQSVRRDAKSNTQDFLIKLCDRLYGSFVKIHRAEGRPWPAARTLREGKGSCRDLAALFMAVCRTQGLACRFTSGYFAGDHKREDKDLHGWAEVFVEGGGWRGFDPTHGLAAADKHVSLASAPGSMDVLPVIGTFRGNDARSMLSARVTMRREQARSL